MTAEQRDKIEKIRKRKKEQEEMEARAAVLRLATISSLVSAKCSGDYLSTVWKGM